MVHFNLDISESKLHTFEGPRGQTEQKNGNGTYVVQGSDSLQKYVGTFTDDNFHGQGVYTQTKPGNNYIYEGTLYANEFEGYAKVIYGNCTYFEGLFKKNKKFGPGFLSYPDGSQDVGFWDGVYLMRLALEIRPGYVPKLATTANGKIEILKNRRLWSIIPPLEEDSIYFGDVEPNNLVRNRNSFFFNHAKYENEFFDNKGRKISVTRPRHDLVKLQKLLLNVKLLQNYTPKELCLLQQKFAILSAVLNDTGRQSTKVKENQEVEVTDLLAWNNENYMLEVLQECFRHRNREAFINYGTSRILQGKRSLFNKPGIYEVSCQLFLEASSDGKDTDIIKLHKLFDINPDVTDSEGNSGVILAACRDQVNALKALVNLGANLDIINDENITALNLCLLRYISVARNIQDWEKSFVLNYDDTHEPDETDEYYTDWKGFDAMVSHSYINYAASMGNLGSETQEKIDLIQQTMNSTITDQIRVSFTFSQPFQSTYAFSPDANQKYLFDWSYPEWVPPKTNKNKVNSKVTKLSSEELGSDDDKQSKCDVIFNTANLLLKLGAKPSFCSYPLPSVLLCLYCDHPDLLKMFIHVDQDLTEVYTKDELTLLHILCLLPPAENQFILASILLKNEVLPSQRCGPDHWKEQIEKIQGDPNFDPSKVHKTKSAKMLKKTKQKSERNVEELQPEDGILIPEEGKTPLHILVLREDFEADPQSHLCQLGAVIAAHVPETMTDFYLGHTPLSLAVLKGNINLINAFLEVGANPNIALAEELGNCFTLYCLKRYGMPKTLPEVSKCKEILDSLVNFGGNPCLPVGQYGNALEFIEADNATPQIIEEEVSTVTKPKSAVSSKKQPSKKSDKLKEQVKLSPQNDIKNHILDLTKQVILTQAQRKLCIYLLKQILEGNIDSCTHLFKFLTKEEAIRVIVLVSLQGLLDLSKDLHYFLALLFLECVNKYGLKERRVVEDTSKDLKKSKQGSDKKSPKTSSKKETDPKNKKKIESKPSNIKPEVQTLPFTNQEVLDTLVDNPIMEQTLHTHYELDENPLTYKMCYYCGRKTGKTLIACPKCGLIYYCSQQCNIQDNKTQTNHKCMVVFYDKELENLRKSPNAKSGTINDMEVSFRKLSLELPVLVFSEHPVLKDLITSIKIFGKVKTNEALEEVLKNLRLMGVNLSNIKFDTHQYEKHNLKELQTRSFSRPSANVLDLVPLPKSVSYLVHKSNLDIRLLSIVNRSTVIHSSESLLSKAVSWGNVQSGPAPYRQSTSDDFLHVMHTSDPHFPIPDDLDSSTLRRKKISSVKTIGVVQLKSEPKLDNDENKKQNQIQNRDRHKSVRTVESAKFKRRSTMTQRRSRMHSKISRKTNSKVVNPRLDPFRKAFGNRKFVSMLNQLFPDYDFTSAMTPFVAYSESQFYYKFSDTQPLYFSTHM